MAEDTPKSDGERNKAFKAERAARLREGVRIREDTRGEVLRLLKEAQDRIKATLADAPTDWQLYHLDKLKAEIARTIAEMEAGLDGAVGAGLDKSWNAGVAMVDAPIAAGGVDLAARLTAIDTRKLEAMKVFCTDRIKDIGTTLVNRINAELGMAMIGGASPFEAAQKIAPHLDGGMKRALTIVRTELGGAFSTATQARQVQAAEILPGLMKQWRRSGKVHSRLSHDLADGQIKKPSEPFMVGGKPIMFPRDPAAPAKERINCGCTSLPHMAHWEMKHPLEKPFTRDELDASPVKRRLEDAQAMGFDTWAKRIVAKQAKTNGTVKTAGSLSPEVEDFLKRKAGATVMTREIGVSDRMLAHYVRDTKQAASAMVDGKVMKGKAVPERVARRLPEILANPKAVLWDVNASVPTLHYIAEVGGAEKRLARFTVRIAEREKRAKLQRHNFVVSAGLVNRTTLADAKAYQLVTGAL